LRRRRLLILPLLVALFFMLHSQGVLAYTNTVIPSYSTNYTISYSFTPTTAPVAYDSTAQGYYISIGPVYHTDWDLIPVWARVDANTTFFWSYSRPISYYDWSTGGGWYYSSYSLFMYGGIIYAPTFSATSGTGVASGGTSGSFNVMESGFKAEQDVITTLNAPSYTAAQFNTSWYPTVTLHWTQLTIAAGGNTTSWSGSIPLTVQFTATATDGVAPYTYSWNFGGQGSSTSQNPIFTFNTPGTYNVTCTATDYKGISDTKSLQVTAYALYLTIQATAGGTTIPAPGTYQEPQGSQVTVTAVPNTNYALGKWQLDGIDSGSVNPFVVTMNANHTITAYFVPGLTVTATANPMSGLAPLNVSFTCTVSGGTPNYTFSWNFGDLGYSAQQNPWHAYAQPGSYTATVTVTDSAGRKGYASVGPIVVTSPFDFTLTKSGDISVVVGQSGTSTIYVTSDVTSASNATQPVTLSIQWIGSVPAYSSATLYPNSVVPNGTSLLSFSTTPSTPLGTYTCRVVGTAGSLTTYVDVLVTVAPQIYSLTVQTTTGGTTSPSPGTYNYPAGASATVTASANTGYAFNCWQLDAVPYSPANPVTITMNANHTITAVFSPTPSYPPSTLTFDVRYWSGSSWSQGDFSNYAWLHYSGAASGSTFASPKTVQVNFSGQASATVTTQIDPRNTDGRFMSLYGGTPEAKVLSADYYVGGSLYESTSPSSITYPSSHDLTVISSYQCLLRANVKWMDYPVNVSANAQWGYAVVTSNSPGWPLYQQQYLGYQNGLGVYNVDYSYYLRVKAYSYAGYYFDRIVVDNSTTYYTDTVLLQNVVSGHNVTVYFSATPPTFRLTVTATYGGTTIPSPGVYMVPRYSYQTVTALLTDPTYYFSNWVLDGSLGGAGSNITVYMDADHNLSAVFDTEYINPESITVAPCDAETGLIFKRAIIGEYLGTNITGKLPGISSPAPVTVTAWLDQAGAWYWDGVSREIVTDGTLKLSGEVTTNSSGWFTMKLGSMDDMCWMGRDAQPGSSFLAYAEIRSGSVVYHFNGSWNIDNVMTSVEFDYDLSGINASFRLLFTDGTSVKNRAGSFITAFKEVDLGWSTSSDEGGVTLLRIPYSKLEGLPYREGTWTVATYTNRTGSPSLMTWFKQCDVRFTELAAQFLMHNETHLAVEVFDWGSPYHPDVTGVSAYLWWDSEFHPWDGKRGVISGCPFGPSDRALLERTDADCYLKDPSGSFWRLGDTVNIPDSCSHIESAIFVTHPDVSSLLNDPNGPGLFYLRLVPPHSMNVLYSPARTGTILLAASIRPPAGW
jgi:PKD repeat protein